MKIVSRMAATVAALFVVTAMPATGAEIVKSYEFALDTWNELGVVDGPVSLHRVRLDRKEDRLTQATLVRRHNQEYLQPIRLHVEYSNSSSAKRKLRVTVRWLDEDGVAIDGFSVAEILQKKSSHRVVQASVATLQYGLDRARTLEVEIRFEP